ncbi:MAG: hypothetical protein WA815_08675 [Terracidiphilus sp.]
MMMKQVHQAELKNMLIEASHALAHLDADRLEEMGLSCAALVRDASAERCDAKTPNKLGLFEATKEIASFASVLEATRANLKVMRRLREVDFAQLGYGSGESRCKSSKEMEHGDH